MKDSNPHTIRQRLDSMFNDTLAGERTGLRRSLIKAAWERLTPAEEWASTRSYRPGGIRRGTA